MIVLPLPIGSMYRIYANIWGILMVNVAIYGIHWSYGLLSVKPIQNRKSSPRSPRYMWLYPICHHPGGLFEGKPVLNTPKSHGLLGDKQHMLPWNGGMLGGWDFYKFFQMFVGSEAPFPFLKTGACQCLFYWVRGITRWPLRMWPLFAGDDWLVVCCFEHCLLPTRHLSTFDSGSNMFQWQIRYRDV